MFLSKPCINGGNQQQPKLLLERKIPKSSIISKYLYLRMLGLCMYVFRAKT